jgi:hypothetical protein
VLGAIKDEAILKNEAMQLQNEEIEGARGAVIKFRFVD